MTVSFKPFVYKHPLHSQHQNVVPFVTNAKFHYDACILPLNNMKGEKRVTYHPATPHNLFLTAAVGEPQRLNPFDRIAFMSYDYSNKNWRRFGSVFKLNLSADGTQLFSPYPASGIRRTHTRHSNTVIRPDLPDLYNLCTTDPNHLLYFLQRVILLQNSGMQLILQNACLSGLSEANCIIS
jgi:hypothetical protein